MSVSRRASFVPMRPIPGDTPVHRLWAGTKLLGIGAIGVTLSFFPWWAASSLMAGFLAVVVAIARIPRAAWPRLPGWFWGFLAFGALLALAAGGAPSTDVAGHRVGLGGLEQLTRFTVVGAILLAGSLLVGWTTSQGDIGPAVARLGRPLRRLHLPVDEWAVVISLCVRCLPLLWDEMRTLAAVRRLRPPPARPAGRSWSSRWLRWLSQPVDLLVAALSVAMRRSGEMGEAITARGGVGTIMAATDGPQRRDAVALVIVGTVCAGAMLLPGG